MPDVFSFEQSSIIVGSLLGDGHLTPVKGKGNSAFVKCQCGAHREYLDWTFSKLGPFSCSIREHDNYCSGKCYKRVVFTSHRDPLFTTLRKRWYPNGTKIVPRPLNLNPLTIAIWFFDDGYNRLAKRNCVFSTNCFTHDDCNYLLELLREFRIEGTITKKNELRIFARSYRPLIDLVKPYMLWSCFEHKIQYRDSELSFTTENEGRKIFELYDAGWTQEKIAAQTGRSISVVSSILRGARMRGLELSSVKDGLALNNTSGHKNVHWDKNRQQWSVSFQVNNKRRTLGRFKEKEEAIKAAEEFRRRSI